jgi:hypothetical protein
MVVNSARPKQGGAFVSPYYEWVRATRFAYYGESKWLPLLIELQDSPQRLGTAADFAGFVLKMQVSGGGPAWVNDVRVPRFYLKPMRGQAARTTFISVLARRRFLGAVYRGQAAAQSIRRFVLGRPNLRADIALSKQPAPVVVANAPWQGAVPQVITAVIDDGIAFAHDRFFDGTGKKTRIEYLWDQQYPSMIYDDLAYGREFTKSDPANGIETLIALSEHGGLVDEDEVYRRSGQLDPSQPSHQPLAFAASHGTHVMDLACNAPLPVVPAQHYVPHQPPVAGVRPIIAVQLPTVTVDDTSGATLEPQIYNGVLYAIVRADEIASRCGSAPLPVLVNASYGIFTGPHDGSSEFERSLDELLQQCNGAAAKPVRVVFPAGNQHLSRCHACVPVPAGRPRDLLWRVLPDDWTESWVEIWLPAGTDVSKVSVTLTAPGGVATSGPVFGGATQNVVISGLLVGMVTYEASVPASGSGRVTIFLAPTGSPDAGLTLAPAGLWCIHVHNAQAVTMVVDAWIRRDDPAPGYRRRGRQSYFDDPQYARFDDGGRAIVDDGTVASYVKRDGTLNGLATGGEPMVIGGFRRSDRVPAPYSASGPVSRPSGPSGPEAMLPSDDAPSHRGVLAAGTRSGSCVAMQGTSVAAPLAARWVAAHMNQPNPPDRQALFQHATAQDPANDKPPAKRGGGGRIAFPSNRRPR